VEAGVGAGQLRSLYRHPGSRTKVLWRPHPRARLRIQRARCRRQGAKIPARTEPTNRTHGPTARAGKEGRRWRLRRRCKPDPRNHKPLTPVTPVTPDP
jgi:hypothetical protein